MSDEINKGRMTNILWRIPNKLCRYSVLKKVKHNSHSVRMAAHRDFLTKTVGWKKGRGKQLTVEKSDKHYLSQRKFKISSDKSG